MTDEQKNAAPQVPTADFRSAPSQEGVGQGEFAGAAPTPRTDALFNAYEVDRDAATLFCGVAQLERELAAAVAERDSKDRQLAECYDKWQKVEHELATAIERLTDTQHRNGKNVVRAEKAEAALHELQKTCDLGCTPDCNRGAYLRGRLAELQKRLDNAGTELPIAAWRWLTTCGFAYHENGPPAKTLPAAEPMCLLADATAAIAKLTLPSEEVKP